MMQWITAKGKVIVDANTLMLAPLLRIYNDDTSETKDTAHRYLAYIHLVSQIDDTAPYYRANEAEVRQLAKRQLFSDALFDFGKDLDAFLEFAIEEYRYAYEEADARAERVFRKKIDQIITEVDKKEPEIVRTNGIKGQVIFVSNIDLINKAMQSLPKLIDIAAALKAKVKKADKDVKVRGDKKESVLIARDKRMEALRINHDEPQTETQGTRETGS